MSNRQEIDCVEGGGEWAGESHACADDFYFALEVAH